MIDIYNHLKQPKAVFDNFKYTLCNAFTVNINNELGALMKNSVNIPCIHAFQCIWMQD